MAGVSYVSYTDLAFLAPAAAIAVDLFVLRTKLVRTTAFWVSYAIVVFFQLITNGLLTGIPIVRYDPSAIIGRRIVYAPVEDLLFGFAMVLLTLATWQRLGARERRRADR